MLFSFRRLSVRASASTDNPRHVSATPVTTTHKRTRKAVERIRMNILPQLLEYQTQIRSLETKMGKLGEVLDCQMATMSTVLDSHHPVPRPNSTQMLMGATRRSPFASKLLLPVEDADLEEISMEMRATDAMWSEAATQHRAAMEAAQEVLHSSQQRAPLYENYRQQLLKLAQEAEVEEAAARSRRRAARAQQREQLRREAEARKAARAKARAQPPAADFVQPAPSATKLNIAVKCQTQLGQEVVLVGSCPELGAWDCSRATPMVWTEGHVWRATLELEQPPERVEYKAVLRQADGSVVWERGDNHVAEMGASQDLDSFHVFAA